MGVNQAGVYRVCTRPVVIRRRCWVSEACMATGSGGKYETALFLARERERVPRGLGALVSTRVC